MLTGGEPFLCGAIMDQVVTAAKECGLCAGVETNGFWARSNSAAEQAIADSGLDELILSASIYHADFIDPQRVVNAWNAAEALGRAAFIRWSQQDPTDSRERDLLNWLCDRVPQNAMEIADVIPIGCAEEFDREPMSKSSHDAKPELCPADGAYRRLGKSSCLL